MVQADPERIGQVLRNLLGNAAKHTPPGTPIMMRAWCQDRHVHIEVTDRGPGIASADQARIFEKFERGSDRRQRSIPGRGLGLYLSRRIVELHGSELTLSSTLGQGTCFSFRLPITGEVRASHTSFE